MQRALHRLEDSLFCRGARRLTISDAWCLYLSGIVGRLGDLLLARRDVGVSNEPSP